MKLDVLVIAAHPDDAELSCGGTVIKLVKQGRKVGLLDLTDGELGTRGTKEISAAEARDAAACLGVTMREATSAPTVRPTPSAANLPLPASKRVGPV